MSSLTTENQYSLVDFFFRLVWEKGIPLDDDLTVSKALKEAGYPSQTSPENSSKARRILKTSTSWANQMGLFGVPVFWLEKNEKMVEWFWGKDSIPYLELFLENKDPLNIYAYKKYLSSFKSL